MKNIAKKTIALIPFKMVKGKPFTIFHVSMKNIAKKAITLIPFKRMKGKYKFTFPIQSLFFPGFFYAVPL